MDPPSSHHQVYGIETLGGLTGRPSRCSKLPTGSSLGQALQFRGGSMDRFNVEGNGRSRLKPGLRPTSPSSPQHADGTRKRRGNAGCLVAMLQATVHDVQASVVGGDDHAVLDMSALAPSPNGPTPVVGPCWALPIFTQHV